MYKCVVSLGFIRKNASVMNGNLYKSYTKDETSHKW